MMNDRHKFRVWNERLKEMLSPEQLEKEKYSLGSNGVVVSFDSDSARRGHLWLCEWMKPLQCTGLKDKNDKLIFEGDLIMVAGDPDVVGSIVWYDGGWRIKYTDNKTPLPVCSVNTRCFEIIGNIHENPELING